MSAEDRRARLRRQVELLLGYRRVGPLTGRVIAVNLDAAEGEIAPILADLVREGWLVEGPDGRYVSSYVSSEEADQLREAAG